MHRNIVFFWGMKSNFYGVKIPRFFSIFGREKKLHPWKIRKNPKKVAVKIMVWPWRLLKVTPVKIKLVHVKSKRKKPRQKRWKFRNNLKILPVKKTEKVLVKKNYAREKSKKTRKNCAWKTNLTREKNEKFAKKAFPPTFFFTPQKKKKH